MAETTFVHFAVEDDRLAVDLSEIREVARVSQIAPVPRAPRVVRGLANIRGRVVTLIDMDVMYARDPSAAPPAAPSGHAVVLAPPMDNLALYTRSRVDIGRGGTAEIEGTPAKAQGTPRSGTTGGPSAGLVVCGGQVAHLVPPAEVAARCESEILARYRRRE